MKLRNTVMLGMFLFSLLSGCKTFDPTPYQNSREKITAVGNNTIEYQTKWHEGLEAHIDLLEEQYISLLKAKVLQETFDRLLKGGSEAFIAEDQDILFPISGNRTTARITKNNEIKNTIDKYTITITIAGSATAYDLVEMYKQEKGATPLFNGLSDAESAFYKNGVDELRMRITDIPSVDATKMEYERLRKIVRDHGEFDVVLAQEHKDFETELIGSLQSAASSLESSAWLAGIGSETLASINNFIEKETEEAEQPTK